MTHKQLQASLTIESAYIFPIVCIIFAAIISICFYLHDTITISSISYSNILEFAHDINNGLKTDDDAIFVDETISSINNVSIRNNYPNLNVSVENNTINYDFSSSILELSYEYKFYSYNNNLRLFKAIHEYVNHKK
jgi:hypothetical protein